MTDIFSREERSRIMGRIKGRDTKPERIVRSLLHRMGYRFRLHRRDLPGFPDIVLPRYRKVIFVHGCFWHGHPGCRRATRPVSNTEFWDDKLSKNMQRDARNLQELKQKGWQALVIWECEINNTELLLDRLQKFLSREKAA